MGKQTKYIFVTGGVLSGIGKGITSASIGNILKSRGLSISVQKCDPYLNVDAGTLNPAEHGECFVTTDGAETDLDLGHYERFIDLQLTQKSSLMSGRLLLKLIQDERSGKFIGKTVQVIPHLTNAIQQEITAAGEGLILNDVKLDFNVTHSSDVPPTIHAVTVTLSAESSGSVDLTLHPNNQDKREGIQTGMVIRWLFEAAQAQRAQTADQSHEVPALEPSAVDDTVAYGHA